MNHDLIRGNPSYVLFNKIRIAHAFFWFRPLHLHIHHIHKSQINCTRCDTKHRTHSTFNSFFLIQGSMNASGIML